MSFNKETGMYEGFIYLITNNVNGKQYVGQTKSTIEHRFGQHISNSKRNRNDVIYKAIRKYGKENFKVEELFMVSCKTVDELQDIINEKEIFYIKKHKTLIPNGYNILIGGNVNPTYLTAKPVCQYDLDGNFIAEYSSASEAYRILGRKSSSGCIEKVCKHKDNICSAYNYLWSYKDAPLIIDEKLSRKYVYQFDLDGNFIFKYDSLQKAANSIGVGSSSIYYACTTGKPEVRGYLWSYDNKSPIYNPYNHGSTKSVDQYDYNGNLIKTFISIKEGVDKSKVKKSETIIKCCKGKIEFTKDGIWRYSGESFKKYSLHKYILYDTNMNPIYSFLTQKEISNFFNSNYKNITNYIDKNNLYLNSYYIRYEDINALESA